MNLIFAIIILIICATVIAISGTILTKTANILADITGIGEALFGAVLLVGITSLPGIVTSVSAALNNHPELAISNAIGGIAAQTVFLCIADITYAKVNLEHAAASLTNIMQGSLLIAMLAFVLVGISGPVITVFHVHPFSVIMIIGYITGTRLISKSKNKPMWEPKLTHPTVKDDPNKNNGQYYNKKKLVVKFLISAIIVAFAGYLVAKSGIVIANKTGLSESFVGVLFTAVATSLPELVVSISAVKQGALILAVGNIIGGNSFDVLFVAFADIFYFKGSIFHAISKIQIFTVSLTILISGILIMGLLYREKKGIGKIGWESFLIIVLYLTGNVFLFFA